MDSLKPSASEILKALEVKDEKNTDEVAFSVGKKTDNKRRYYIIFLVVMIFSMIATIITVTILTVENDIKGNQNVIINSPKYEEVQSFKEKSENT